MRAFSLSACVSFSISLGVWDLAPAQEALSEVPQEPLEQSTSGDEQTRYQVEVIVFAYNAFDPSEEVFDRGPGLPTYDPKPPSAASPLIGHRRAPDATGSFGDLPRWFSLLSAEELELTAEYDKLQRLDAYTVLLHGGWIQEGLPEEGAQPFDLSLLGASAVTGTMQVHLGRYLHITAALDYQRKEDPAQRPVAAPKHHLDKFGSPPNYALRQTRRTRSGELNYFDHPAFGLLVIVRPRPESL